MWATVITTLLSVGLPLLLDKKGKTADNSAYYLTIIADREKRIKGLKYTVYTLFVVIITILLVIILKKKK